MLFQGWTQGCGKGIREIESGRCEYLFQEKREGCSHKRNERKREAKGDW